MSQEKVKIILKITKYFVIALLAMFFVIIIVQSVKINNLTATRNNMQKQIESKQQQEEDLNNKYNEISTNEDKYWEDILRDNDYKKQDETMVKAN